MKIRERMYLLLEPFVAAPHHVIVRQELQLCAPEGPARILDVGGRKSPYTVGLAGRVTVTDLPRENALQHDLNLGMTEEMVREFRRARSNVTEFKFDDMTDTRLTDRYDIVVAVEVLEHVEADERFVANIRRVLRPGGVFVMTTPNGQAVPNGNPDHKRHYQPAELRSLLGRHFEGVEVQCAIGTGWAQYLAYRSALRNWFASPIILGCRVMEYCRSRRRLRMDPGRTNLLVAIAR